MENTVTMTLDRYNEMHTDMIRTEDLLEQTTMLIFDHAYIRDGEVYIDGYDLARTIKKDFPEMFDAILNFKKPLEDETNA